MQFMKELLNDIKADSKNISIWNYMLKYGPGVKVNYEEIAI